MATRKLYLLGPSLTAEQFEMRQPGLFPLHIGMCWPQVKIIEDVKFDVGDCGSRVGHSGVGIRFLVGTAEC
jgi:hypothetical protein